MHRKKRIEENTSMSFFDMDNQAYTTSARLIVHLKKLTLACTGRVTFCYALTSWTTELWSVTLSSHTWV